MSPKSKSANDAETLILSLAQALHAYGTPAHRLEEAMSLLARRLGLTGQFFATPTALFAALGSGDEQRTRLLRVEPGQVDLEKLSRLDRVLTRALAGELGPRQAIRHIHRVVAAAPRYGRLATTLAFALASATAAYFLGGGWPEIGAGGAVGLGVGLMTLLIDRIPASRRLYEILAATLAAALATSIAALSGQLAAPIATLAGLIILLPGLNLTIAMSELATRHLVSGASRMAGVSLVFLTLGFGTALGRHLGTLVAGPAPIVIPQPPPWPTVLVALPLAALSFVVLFQARPREFGWITLVGAAAIGGGRLGVAWLGADLGPFLGALVVGLASNLLARYRDRPTALTQLPALILLVPGSLGLRSISALLASDTLAGVQSLFGVALVAVSLVAGLLMANVLLPPRRVL